MPKQSLCLRIPRKQGETTIVLLSKLKIIDSDLRIQRNQDFIYVPLKAQLSGDRLKAFRKQMNDCLVMLYDFPERKTREQSLMDLLDSRLPRHLMAHLPHSIDFVGEIAIVEVPPELGDYKSIIGEAILHANQNVRTVLAKAGIISGMYRLRELDVIAGEPETSTIHKEYGCQYYVDITKAYFSPRLSHEHDRVASLVGRNETVVDMFAGVGPFSIQIGRRCENVRVYAIDVNPDAIAFLERNIRLNRVESKVYPLLGDAKQIIRERLSGVADRVIMNLPEKAIEFVDAACEAIRSTGGIIHFYSFMKAHDSLETIHSSLAGAVNKNGRRMGLVFSRPVRPTAPYEWQVVLDVRIN